MRDIPCPGASSGLPSKGPHHAPHRLATALFTSTPALRFSKLIRQADSASLSFHPRSTFAESETHRGFAKQGPPTLDPHPLTDFSIKERAQRENIYFLTSFAWRPISWEAEVAVATFDFDLIVDLTVDLTVSFSSSWASSPLSKVRGSQVATGHRRVQSSCDSLLVRASPVSRPPTLPSPGIW